MRKNRKRSKKMSVMATRSMHVGAVMVMFFVMVILNLLASSSCTQILKSIGEKERLLTKLEDERMRESARWDAMKTADNIDRALLKFGLSMRYARASQIVRMDSAGRPKPGQLALARAKKNAANYRTASAGRVR